MQPKFSEQISQKIPLCVTFKDVRERGAKPLYFLQKKT